MLCVVFWKMTRLQLIRLSRECLLVGQKRHQTTLVRLVPPYNRQRQPPLPLQCIPLFQDFAQFLSTPYGHGYTGVSTPQSRASTAHTAAEKNSPKISPRKNGRTRRQSGIPP